MSSWMNNLQMPFGSSRLQGKSAARIAVRVGVGLLIWMILLFVYRNANPSAWVGSGVGSTDALKPQKVPYPKSKVAFAVLLAPNFIEDADQEDIESDKYFLGTRVLNYQLRHSIRTKYHDPDVPLLVLCPPPVSERKRRILAQEGATIVPVPFVREDWMKMPLPQWDAVMSKVYLWTYTEYDKILYIDADMLLVESLNGVFEDPAAQEYKTDFNKTDPNDPRAHLIPPSYVLGGVLDGVSGDREHPAYEDYLNVGFFMFKPDLTLFNLFMDYVKTPNSFSMSMPEQNLINDVFRKDGGMHWQRLDPHWDTSCPTAKDIELGWKTLHGKYWALSASPCDLDPVAARMWYQVLGHMEAFYAGGRPL